MSDLYGQDRNGKPPVNRGKEQAIGVLGLVLVSLVLLTGLLGGRGLVRAEGATINLNPTPLALGVNGTGFVEVLVGDYSSPGGLGAYTLVIEYDETVVRVTGIDEGDPPFAGGTPAVGNEGGGGPITSIDNDTGEARLLAFQASEATGPTGNIRIARINFEAAGTSGATSDLRVVVAGLVDAQSGEFVPVTAADGMVTIGGGPGEVSGKTTLEFRPTTGGRAMVEIVCPSLTKNTVPAEDGSWQISGVPAESCELSATAPGYLTAAGTLVVGNAPVELPANELLGGDANQSGNVDTTDISGVVAGIGQFSEDCQVDGLVVDVACDNGFVDTADISATVSNIGKGIQPYPTQ